ncbi:MAG: hydroxyacylglutathione hydrolase [Rhodocyclaceae bacterium]|jgi:hydroxyacylglutathione hydrolase|nr:hydroxyacylglutathione hydrolase [Rhodocyclaceae bacterium]
MEIIPLPAFRDNYIWALRAGRHAVVVDPGDAGPALTWLTETGLDLDAILVTHHHADHVAGIQALLAAYPAPVYGPADEAIPGRTHPVGEGSRITLPGLGLTLETMAVPGHTLGHLAYYAPGLVLCGDTLFSAGCGRLFEGTPAQLHGSLNRLAALPGDTAVYCTHEYTLANLAFARLAEPHNPERDAWATRCEALRRDNRPTLPTTIERERRINPFLRTGETQIAQVLASRLGRPPEDALACFAALREWKNQA